MPILIGYRSNWDWKFNNKDMDKQQEPFEFDDNEAIQFIIKNLSSETQAKITDDDVQYVLDLICEYYDENHLMDEDSSDEASIAEDDMHNFIWNIVKKEKIAQFTEDELQEILDGEFEYGKRIGIYTEG